MFHISEMEGVFSRDKNANGEKLQTKGGYLNSPDEPQYQDQKQRYP